jgi:hypothetical protein
LGLAKGGKQKVTSDEFEGRAAESLLEEYYALKGRLTAKEKVQKQKLQKQLKGMGIKGSSLNKAVNLTPTLVGSHVISNKTTQATLQAQAFDAPASHLSFQFPPLHAPPAPGLTLVGIFVVGGALLLAGG